MKKIFPITALLTFASLTVGCATVKGTVYKQKDGTYKASYASNTEKNVRKVLHFDASLTCKKKEGTKEFIVIDELVEKTEDDSKKEGFAAVADSAVSLAGKYFGAESVRGNLVFTCDK
ncbi:hypothetical protein [Teredinibacter waterburyi]|jgi:hypothetical protein|uniref:hypothetical protein n=1 Tax=Teredinibacter waterburyi TaxID=1500538 RepID=UPI00165F209F|nr:hypothetical protein [Teredinibacter waterburyi]